MSLVTSLVTNKLKPETAKEPVHDEDDDDDQEEDESEEEDDEDTSEEESSEVDECTDNMVESIASDLSAKGLLKTEPDCTALASFFTYW